MLSSAYFPSPSHTWSKAQGINFRMTRCLGFAGLATKYGSLSSCQRFLQDTLIHNFGLGHRVFPVSTLAIYLFPTCGTRPGDQWRTLLENLVWGVCLLNILCQVACRMHAWYRPLCSRFNLLHHLNDGEAELVMLRMECTAVPRSILKPLHCLNACAQTSGQTFVGTSWCLRLKRVLCCCWSAGTLCWVVALASCTGCWEGLEMRVCAGVGEAEVVEGQGKESAGSKASLFFCSCWTGRNWWAAALCSAPGKLLARLGTLPRFPQGFQDAAKRDPCEQGERCGFHLLLWCSFNYFPIVSPTAACSQAALGSGEDPFHHLLGS